MLRVTHLAPISTLSNPKVAAALVVTTLKAHFQMMQRDLQSHETAHQHVKLIVRLQSMCARAQVTLVMILRQSSLHFSQTHMMVYTIAGGMLNHHLRHLLTEPCLRTNRMKPRQEARASLYYLSNRPWRPGERQSERQTSELQAALLI
jgi:hypothetical protein